MFSPLISILLIPFLTAMFLAINMGGSGTAPSFSSAYGANIIRKDLIPGLFGIFVFLGALVAGKKVVLTIGGSILPSTVMGLSLTTIILLSVSLSLLSANLLRVPQSTSQSTVFALVGPAIYFDILQTQKLFFEIIPAWFILPVVSFAITYFIGRAIYNPIHRKGIIQFKELSEHPFFKLFVIAASLYVAFAIGSNNVANAAGPLASMVSNDLNIDPSNSQFLTVLIITTLLIAPCFGIGSSLLGHRVLETTGKEIVRFGPLGATLIAFITATLLLLASVSRGIPTSLVQMNTAAIIGLGISKVGWRRIIKQTSIKKLFTIWILAPLISLFLSFLFTAIASKMGIL
jgi:sulfate permease